MYWGIRPTVRGRTGVILRGAGSASPARPSAAGKVTEENREVLARMQAQRHEGKFGQGKNGYHLNRIRAKRADTSAAWINRIFPVMNLLIPLRIFLCWIERGLWWVYCAFGRGCFIIDKLIRSPSVFLC